MKKMLTALAILLTSLLTPLAGRAQDSGFSAREIISIPLASEYDLDSSSYIYPVTTGINSLVTGGWRPSTARIKTSGSSTTVTALNSSFAAFTGLAAGDEMLIAVGDGTTARRTVTAVASGTSITVNAVITLTSASYVWRKLDITTAGWINVRGLRGWNYHIQVTQEVSSSIDVIEECKLESTATTGTEVFGPNTNPAGSVPTANQTGTFSINIVVHDQPWDMCRVGVRVNTDDGNDLTTNAEKLQMVFEGWR